LCGEETFRMRAATRAASTRTKPRAGPASAPKLAIPEADRPLFEALKALRLRLASAAKVPPYVILHDRTLVELARARPTDLEALRNFTGLGASKIRRYGSALIETIANFKPHPLLNNRLGASVNATLALHLQGLDAQAIAAERKIEVSTVYAHFAEAIEAGLLTADDVLDLD